MERRVWWREPYALGCVAALLAVVGFSVRSVWLKIIIERSGMDAFSILFFRLLFALPVCLFMAWPALRRLRSASVSLRALAAFFVLGPSAFYGSLYLDQAGLAFIPAAAERLILFVYPTLTLIFANVADRTRISPHDWAGSLLAYAGVAWVFAGDLPQGASGTALRDYLIGAASVAVSAVIYALFVTWGRRGIERLGAAPYSGLVMAGALIPACVHACVLGEFPAWERAQPVLGWLPAAAVFGTAVPVWLFAEATKRIGAPRAAAFSVSGPPLTLAFGALALGEPLTTARALGSLLAMAGVAYLTVPMLREGGMRRFGVKVWLRFINYG